MIAPHDPYRFEADCTLRDPSSPGTEFGGPNLPEYRQLYADQTECIANKLDQAMTDLIAADPTAIVVLMADHGSGFEAVSTLDWSETQLRERMAIFRMTRLPESCRSNDLAAEASINTSEIITSCIAGETPELVEPRAFLTAWRPDFDVVESNVAIIPANGTPMESDG